MRARTTAPRGTRRGRAELADVITRISRHDRTFHLIGNSRYDVDGDHATGEVYCEAHHLDRPANEVDGQVDPHDRGTDHVMYIRYQDAYEKTSDGEWRIAERRVLVDWTETRTIAP